MIAKQVYFLKLGQLQTIIQKVCFMKDENEVATMLDFYHDLGIIVKHRNTVVLQAQWLIRVFKQLIALPTFNEMVRKINLKQTRTSLTCTHAGRCNLQIGKTKNFLHAVFFAGVQV